MNPQSHVHKSYQRRNFDERPDDGRKRLPGPMPKLPCHGDGQLEIVAEAAVNDNVADFVVGTDALPSEKLPGT